MGTSTARSSPEILRAFSECIGTAGGLEIGTSEKRSGYKMTIMLPSLIQQITLDDSLKKHFGQHQMDFPRQTSNQSVELTATRCAIAF